MTFDSINDGASGVDMGRNIWQSDHPVAMIKAIRSIVHENYNFQEAYNLFVTESKSNSKIQYEKQIENKKQ